jgi:putative alpha-1,2-mannosidase
VAGAGHGADNAGPMQAVGRAGVEYYNELGYVPYDVGINESAARTLEYAYDDFAIYQLGKALGKPESEIAIYAERAMNYKKLFDPETGLMRGKNRTAASSRRSIPSNGATPSPRGTAGTTPGRCSRT